MKVSNTSERLKELMRESSLKQVDILEKAKPYCKKYGIKLTKSDLSQYISGKVEPGQAKLFVLAQTLEVSEAWLMGYDIPKNQPDTEKIENIQLSDIKFLKILFQHYGYILKQENPLLYTLTNKSEKNFMLTFSSYQLNTILYDIGDYISTTIGDRLEEIVKRVREMPEYYLSSDEFTSITNERTDIEPTEKIIKYNNKIINSKRCHFTEKDIEAAKFYLNQKNLAAFGSEITNEQILEIANTLYETEN